jgi:hypothetical protein
MGWTTIEKEMELIAQGKYRFPMSINGETVHTAEEALAKYRELNEQHERLIRSIREEWLETAAGKLCQEMYRKFQEYKLYLEQNPRARPDTDFPGADFHEHDLFKQGLLMMREYERRREEKDLRNLRRAHEAARCRHEHADGRRCGSPRVRGKKLCHWHQRVEEAKALKLDLGPMEDPDSIQVAIMKLQRAVIDGALDPKTTGQLAYTIQLAAWNVSRTRIARAGKEEKVS